jgi:hypothetical protein
MQYSRARMAFVPVNARSEYVARINRVIDYVQAHLAEESLALSAKRLAPPRPSGAPKATAG